MRDMVPTKVSFATESRDTSGKYNMDDDHDALTAADDLKTRARNNLDGEKRPGETV